MSAHAALGSTYVRSANPFRHFRAYIRNHSGEAGQLEAPPRIVKCALAVCCSKCYPGCQRRRSATPPGPLHLLKTVAQALRCCSRCRWRGAWQLLAALLACLAPPPPPLLRGAALPPTGPPSGSPGGSAGARPAAASTADLVDREGRIASALPSSWGPYEVCWALRGKLYLHCLASSAMLACLLLMRKVWYDCQPNAGRAAGKAAMLPRCQRAGMLLLFALVSDQHSVHRSPLFLYARFHRCKPKSLTLHLACRCSGEQWQRSRRYWRRSAMGCCWPCSARRRARAKPLALPAPSLLLLLRGTLAAAHSRSAWSRSPALSPERTVVRCLPAHAPAG